jgi:hypothetical protein
MNACSISYSQQPLPLQVLLLWDTSASTLEVKLLPSESVEYSSVRCLSACVFMCCALFSAVYVTSGKAKRKARARIANVLHR